MKHKNQHFNPVPSQDLTIPDDTPEPDDIKITHDVRFALALVIGFGVSLLFRQSYNLNETTDELVVRPSRHVAIFLECLAVYAFGELGLYVYCERPSLQTICSLFFFGLLVFGTSVPHYSSAYVSVDDQRLISYEPVLSLFSKSEFSWNDVRTIQVRESLTGKSSLLISRKDSGLSETFDLSPMLQSAMPRIRRIVHEKGISGL